MIGSGRCVISLALAGLFVLLLGDEPSVGQQAKDKAVPKGKGNAALLVPEPLAIKPGEGLSVMTPVIRPTAVRGAISWALETRKHRNRPSSVSLSPDGTLVATGSWDGTIHIWDVASGKLLRVLVGHGSSVYGVAFSPDGNFLASAGSFDETARVWNPKTGMTLRILKKHKGFTSGVAWSPDGATLAVSGGTSGFVTFWDPAQSKQLRTIEHGNPVNGMAWAPDGKTVACGTDQGAFLWKAADGSNAGTIKVAGNKVPAVGWSPDGKHLLVGAMKSVDVWDIPGNKLVNSMEGTGWFVAWSPDGQTAATSYGEGMQLWDMKAYARRSMPKIAALGFAWTKKSETLLVLSPQDVVLLNVSDEKQRSFAVATADTMYWSNGRPIVSGINDTTLKLWDAATGKLLGKVAGHTEAVGAVAWSKDGKWLATGSNDLTARVWDGKNGKLLRTMVGHGKEVKAVAWSPEGKLATASADKIVRVFPADNDTPQELKGHTHPVRAVAWRDSKTLVSGGEDGKVLVWNLETGKVAQPAQTIDVDHDVAALAFSPDGNLLACGCLDDVARIYSLSGGKALHALDPKTGSTEFYNLAWSPDGTLATTSNYRVWLWNAKTEKQLHGYQIGGGTHNIAFSPDGRITIAGCLDPTVRFCDTPTGLLRGTMINDGKQIVSISVEGHHKAPGDIETEFVYVVQTEKTQDTYDPKTFVAKFGWKSNPAAVKLLGN
jgi:WD40 repeat protein